jgi:hypothetical protein
MQPRDQISLRESYGLLLQISGDLRDDVGTGAIRRGYDPKQKFSGSRLKTALVKRQNYDDLHVVRGADLRLQLSVLQPLRHIHISNFDRTVLRKEGVCHFQIAMTDALAVQMIQSL